MLKITINNEEVVSNKDFTIEEEMLNTSSVILNNVYPKSWETDKDYVSRFYHPNDYSKCLIKDEDYTPAEPGLNEEGTNFQITADTTKLNELTSMKGNTTQDSTPTPTTPVPINVVSGRQDIVVCGKNFLDISDYTLAGSRRDFTFNNDGTITFYCDNTSGTSNLSSESILFQVPNNMDFEVGETLYIVAEITSIESDNTSGYQLVLDNGYGSLNPVFSGLKQVPVVLGVATRNGVVANNAPYGKFLRTYKVTEPGKISHFTFRLMIVKDNTDTEYEAYKGNTYEINLGKNLLSNYSTTQTKNGVSYTVNQDKSITLNGTSTGAFIVEIASGLTLEAGTYTLSLRGKIQGCGIYAYTGSGVLKTYVSSNNTPDNWKTNFTLDSTTTFTQIRIDVQINKTFDNITIYPMIEKGSQATSYAPYKTPIELCKIGNYQDRIYKDGNKWYLEKQTNKVDLSTLSWTNATTYAYSRQLTDIKYVSSNQVVGDGLAENYRLRQGSGMSSTSWQGYMAIDTAQITINPNNVNQPAKGMFYYVLRTPTTTEITDTELISQLNSIELLEGLNNVSVVSPYLQGIINIHYNYVNETTTSDLLFCGVVKNSGNISLNPRHPHYQTLQILDFKTFLSEGETMDFVIANKTIEEAIDQVVDTISPYGFIKGNIEILGAETIIGAYSTKDKTAYDVFNYLADITQSRWTTRLIDENTVAIDFYDPTLLPRGETIQYNETWFRNNLIDDISYSYGSNDYRNKQVMTSKEVIGELEQVQIVYANGYQTQFMTEIKIAQINEIDVNGEPKTFATEDDKELGVEADFYYSIGNNIIESADTYPTGAVITIRYLPIVEGRQIITNNDEIDRVSTATGRKGVVARYEDRNDAITSNELQLIGQSYIRYKGVPEIKLNVQTRSNLWNIGDRVQFNAPITELATEYMVKKKTINRILANPDSEEHIIYTFELTSSFNSEQAINYFDNQRAKSKGNIGEGEAISRNIDIENETNIIFYDSNIVEITVVGDNVLNSTLNSPLNN